MVVHDVRPGLERAAQDADAANSSLGTAAAMESSDGVDMVSTFFTAVLALQAVSVRSLWVRLRSRRLQREPLSDRDS